MGRKRKIDTETNVELVEKQKVFLEEIKAGKYDKELERFVTEANTYAGLSTSEAFELLIKNFSKKVFKFTPSWK